MIPCFGSQVYDISILVVNFLNGCFLFHQFNNCIHIPIFSGHQQWGLQLCTWCLYVCTTEW